MNVSQAACVQTSIDIVSAHSIKINTTDIQRSENQPKIDNIDSID